MLKKIVRREFLTLRVTREEKKIIQDKASESKKDVSTFAREILLSDAV